ncbi:MAG: hypothetical protein QF470_03545 [Methylococcales bacterium]|jgi:hypothetical protein|nr:hypothetical protein [Methylococcales bacterium]
MTINTRPSRRHFLQKTLISISAALIPLLPNQVFAKKAPIAPKKPTSLAPYQGYHETKHIKTYYQKARF